MGTMTPAQRRALYESARFARETTYNAWMFMMLI